MRALFFSLAMFAFAASAHGQNYNYTCPNTYAFNFAGLQWYDTIYLHEVYGECEESPESYYFGYSSPPSALGAADMGCVCGHTDPPDDQMFNRAPPVLSDEEISAGVRHKEAGEPLAVKVVFDKLIVEALDPDNGDNPRYFLCMCATRTGSMSRSHTQFVLAREIARPAIGSVHFLRILTGGVLQPAKDPSTPQWRRLKFSLTLAQTALLRSQLIEVANRSTQDFTAPVYITSP